jgi:hypothetical protein
MNPWIRFGSRCSSSVRKSGALDDEIGFLTASLIQGLTGTATSRPSKYAGSGSSPLRTGISTLHRGSSTGQVTSGPEYLWPDSQRIGWKEPNTHIVMDRLPALLPQMKYIHVMRNGLDMAHSRNQNQLRLWGRYLVGPDCRDDPRSSLKYWCRTHQRILRLCQPLGARFVAPMMLFAPAESASGNIQFWVRPLPGSARLMVLVQPNLSVDSSNTRSINLIQRMWPMSNSSDLTPRLRERSAMQLRRAAGPYDGPSELYLTEVRHCPLAAAKRPSAGT